MLTGDLCSGHTVPLLIPEPIWREWNMNGVGAAALAELRAEYGAVVGYEFDWGQIIEAGEDGDPSASQTTRKACPYRALRWHFVLCGVHNEFLDVGGNLGELSDLAINVLAGLKQSREELSAGSRDDGLPACICFDEGNNIHAFARMCVSMAIRLLQAKKKLYFHRKS